MEFQIGDIVKLKKAHPCGTNEWEILRVGMDFRLKCVGCSRQVMVPRKMIEKNFRGFIKKACHTYLKRKYVILNSENFRK